jgi:hypothetical protein
MWCGRESVNVDRPPSAIKVGRILPCMLPPKIVGEQFRYAAWNSTKIATPDIEGLTWMEPILSLGFHCGLFR